MQINLSILKPLKTPILLSVLSLFVYFNFAYNLQRTEYLKLTALYTALFAFFYWLVSTYKKNINLLTAFTFLFRAVFIVAIPNLSQDFYRFIWDGNMILEGYNPYLHTVSSFIDANNYPFENALSLYYGMGYLNASHFTNYPPVNQFCFVLANLIPGNSILSSVIGLRLIIIAADFGSFYFGKKLLKTLGLPIHNIFWLLLNPFIIIELTGNLHFEGVMVFFLIWSLYLLQKGNWIWSAVVLALSIATKLIPLLFLPLFFQWFTTHSLNTSKILHLKSNLKHPEKHSINKSLLFKNIKKLIVFYTVVGITTVLLFAPFFSLQFVSNYTQTVGLWFKNFEFNASIYYIARAVGYTFRGYNEIAIIGKAIPILVILFVLINTFLKKRIGLQQLIVAMLMALSFYYFISTTVHPWYVVTLLALSIFTNYKFPLVWSYIIILSYLAYIQIGNASKQENLIIIGIEYLIVYSVFIWEIFNQPKQVA